jgi:hypothetical protein
VFPINTQHSTDDVLENINYLLSNLILSLPEEGDYRSSPDEGDYRSLPDEGYYRSLPLLSSVKHSERYFEALESNECILLKTSLETSYLLLLLFIIYTSVSIVTGILVI